MALENVESLLEQFTYEDEVWYVIVEDDEGSLELRAVHVGLQELLTELAEEIGYEDDRQG